MEAARAWGVPRSVFLGRPQPGPGEPLWLAEDRWWALALLEAEAGTCRDCGMPTAESTDPANEYGYTAEPFLCHGCVAVALRVRALQDGDARTDGLQVHVHKKG